MNKTIASLSKFLGFFALLIFISSCQKEAYFNFTKIPQDLNTGRTSKNSELDLKFDQVEAPTLFASNVSLEHATAEEKEAFMLSLANETNKKNNTVATNVESQKEINSLAIGQKNQKPINYNIVSQKISRAEKKELKNKIKDVLIADTDMLLKIILAFLLPPLAVYLHKGVGDLFWISIILTLLFWVPGIIFAVLVITDTI